MDRRRATIYTKQFQYYNRRSGSKATIKNYRQTHISAVMEETKEEDGDL